MLDKIRIVNYIYSRPPYSYIDDLTANLNNSKHCLFSLTNTGGKTSLINLITKSLLWGSKNNKLDGNSCFADDKIYYRHENVPVYVLFEIILPNNSRLLIITGTQKIANDDKSNDYKKFAITYCYNNQTINKVNINDIKLYEIENNHRIVYDLETAKSKILEMLSKSDSKDYKLYTKTSENSYSKYLNDLYTKYSVDLRFTHKYANQINKSEGALSEIYKDSIKCYDDLVNISIGNVLDNRTIVNLESNNNNIVNIAKNVINSKYKHKEDYTRLKVYKKLGDFLDKNELNANEFITLSKEEKKLENQLSQYYLQGEKLYNDKNEKLKNLKDDLDVENDNITIYTKKKDSLKIIKKEKEYASLNNEKEKLISKIKENKDALNFNNRIVQESIVKTKYKAYSAELGTYKAIKVSLDEKNCTTEITDLGNKIKSYYLNEKEELYTQNNNNDKDIDNYKKVQENITKNNNSLNIENGRLENQNITNNDKIEQFDNEINNIKFDYPKFDAVDIRVEYIATERWNKFKSQYENQSKEYISKIESFQTDINNYEKDIQIQSKKLENLKENKKQLDSDKVDLERDQISINKKIYKINDLIKQTDLSNFDVNNIILGIANNKTNYEDEYETKGNEIREINNLLNRYEDYKTSRVSVDIIEVLNENNIDYVFGDYYIKHFNDNDKVRQELLLRHPYLPYSIILSNDEEYQKYKMLNKENLDSDSMCLVLTKSDLKNDNLVIDIDKLLYNYPSDIYIDNKKKIEELKERRSKLTIRNNFLQDLLKKYEIIKNKVEDLCEDYSYYNDSNNIDDISKEIDKQLNNNSIQLNEIQKEIDNVTKNINNLKIKKEDLQNKKDDLESNNEYIKIMLDKTGKIYNKCINVIIPLEQDIIKINNTIKKNNESIEENKLNYNKNTDLIDKCNTFKGQTEQKIVGIESILNKYIEYERIDILETNLNINELTSSYDRLKEDIKTNEEDLKKQEKIKNEKYNELKESIIQNVNISNYKKLCDFIKIQDEKQIDNILKSYEELGESKLLESRIKITQINEEINNCIKERDSISNQLDEKKENIEEYYSTYKEKFNCVPFKDFESNETINNYSELITKSNTSINNINENIKLINSECSTLDTTLKDIFEYRKDDVELNPNEIDFIENVDEYKDIVIKIKNDIKKNKSSIITESTKFINEWNSFLNSIKQNKDFNIDELKNIAFTINQIFNERNYFEYNQTILDSVKKMIESQELLLQSDLKDEETLKIRSIDIMETILNDFINIYKEANKMHRTDGTKLLRVSGLDENKIYPDNLKKYIDEVIQYFVDEMQIDGKINETKLKNKLDIKVMLKQYYNFNKFTVELSIKHTGHLNWIDILEAIANTSGSQSVTASLMIINVFSNSLDKYVKKTNNNPYKPIRFLAIDNPFSNIQSDEMLEDFFDILDLIGLQTLDFTAVQSSNIAKYHSVQIALKKLESTQQTKIKIAIDDKNSGVLDNETQQFVMGNYSLEHRTSLF